MSDEDSLVKEARENLVTILVNEFTQESFKDFQESFLKAECSGQTIIPIYIDSGGGEVNTLFSMIDLIKSSKLPVATVATGRAQSCGADLLASGTRGYRYISPLCVVMVHEGEGGYIGPPSSIQTHAAEELRVIETSFGLLDKHCDKLPGYWDETLKGLGYPDYYMSAEEAKSHGLCDFVRLPRFEPEITVKTKIV